MQYKVTKYSNNETNEMKYEIFKLVNRMTPEFYEVPDDTPFRDDAAKIELFSGLDPNRDIIKGRGPMNTFKITFAEGTVHVVSAADWTPYWRPIHESEIAIEDRYTTVDAGDLLTPLDDKKEGKDE